VYFAYDSDRILPKSYDLLDDVARVMIEHTEIPKIRVEGHTDSDGSDRYNLDLSDRRARSVMAYLVAAGVENERLDSRGFGEEQPIAPNDTKPGKAKNRRVEFTIIDPEGQVEGVYTEDEAPEGEPLEAEMETEATEPIDEDADDAADEDTADEDGEKSGAVPPSDDDDVDDLFVDE